MTLRKLGMKRLKTRRLGDRFSTGLAVGLKKSGGMATRGGQFLSTLGGMTANPALLSSGALLMTGGNVAQMSGETIQNMKSVLEK